MAEERLQRWCPNCCFFYKEMGMNYCHLADGSEGYDPTGYDQQALEWIKTVQWADGVIVAAADNCPRFVPFAELAQGLWARQNGMELTPAQVYWIARKASS
jgi:hypothetical protein